MVDASARHARVTGSQWYTASPAASAAVRPAGSANVSVAAWSRKWTAEPEPRLVASMSYAPPTTRMPGASAGIDEAGTMARLTRLATEAGSDTLTTSSAERVPVAGIAIGAAVTVGLN